MTTRAPSPGPLPTIRRRIVIVIGSFAAGGAERVAATLANAWHEGGDDVWIVSTYVAPHEPAYPLRQGVVSIDFWQLFGPGRPWRWADPLRKLCKLRQLLRSANPDVIISFLTHVNLLTILARAGSSIPLIISERTDPLHDVHLKLALRAGRVLGYRCADALVVQSATAAARYAARVPGLPRLTVIPNPLPAALAEGPLRAQPGGPGRCVVAMGRLTAEKGFAKLIRAFGAAFGDEPSWQLKIWGEGPLRPTLQELVDQLQLSRRIELCGLTREPWKALATGQIFVLSSDYEGFPNAMLEAMALGLPCIAFDCPSGPRELADGGDAALLVPAGDVARLAAALKELAQDAQRRIALGARGAEFVRRRFAAAAVLERWQALIESLLEQRRRSRADAHPGADAP